MSFRTSPVVRAFAVACLLISGLQTTTLLSATERDIGHSVAWPDDAIGMADATAVAASLLPQFSPLLGYELYLLICKALADGCDKGCRAVVAALLEMELIDLSDADASYNGCVQTECSEMAQSCMELIHE